VGDGALNRAVFLDRDGVINEPVVRDGLPHPPESASTLQLTPGCAPALAELHALGFMLIVVTNQPDIARGTRTRADIDAINARLSSTLPIDGFYVCDHDDADRCACRKPLPGLIVGAAREHGVDLAGSYLIGDRWRDIAAGRAAGVTTIFIDRGYAEARPEPPADFTTGALAAAAHWIQGKYS
jgi:D-glycero-D-manno-heptose 1,7-bisphosphate phosphatase